MSIRTALALAALLSVPAIEATASVTYTYVGSWDVSDGPIWFSNPVVYTGQEAAAFIFGGNAADYVISTVSSNVGDINFSTWLDGWGDEFTYGLNGNPAPQNYSLDLTGLGYNGCGGGQAIAQGGFRLDDCNGSAYSAYVRDHFQQGQFINYAFTVAAVPVPAGGLLLITALGGLGFAFRRRRA